MNFNFLSTLLALPTLILCESPPLISLPPPPLPDCVTPCPLILQPVCGSDGKTYSNECDLSNARCKNPGDDITVKYKGRCEEDCVTPCPLILQPVCGSDGKTYSNECDLSNARCKNPGDDITVKYKGRCEEVCKDVVVNCASMLASCDNVAMQEYCKKSCGVCGINNEIARTDFEHIKPELMEFPGARFIGAHTLRVDIPGQFPPSQRTGTEFSCLGRDQNNKFYGNPATDCKTFHHCGPGSYDRDVLILKFHCKDGKQWNENTCSCDNSGGNCQAQRGCSG